ncbi:PREDICTED: breast carcinoma-amplified sequence 3 homolog isoform X2 [Nicrophorus vespilloides]|uniref:Breast carcinoma-amplified sequence 3 homolog isoform X2 n=1 Tax=Nicrophorus vespilloides TaxID=110193 RepID=A0ABM1MF85_NICVS|nr:PREDICTED: breast carcinoma-amplified sequence 3 homolog isoform X2 [Nicrophorus vespilloides]
MSADSPIKAKLNHGNNIVLPQQVTDPTILDSVAGFINDVVPNAYNLPSDTKDQIQWARFERVEVDELNNCCMNGDKVIPPSIILVLGYTTGIQIWAIQANGEATEILSWRHGSVRVLRILPCPYRVGYNVVDSYNSKRPLIALCDTVTPGSDYCSLSFISLRTAEQVKLIRFKNQILDVVANRRSVVVTFSERIAIFDAFNLEDKLTITTCYLSPGIYPNPVALGPRWLAYAENKLLPARRSSGGNDGEGVQSYTATVLHAAKSLGRGLRELGETVASSLTGNVPHKATVTGSSLSSGLNEVQQKGVITILDIENQNIESNEKGIHGEGIVAHFTAHKEAVVYLSFDPSGLLLLTADKRGYDFHLFRIHSHPGGPALAAIHHLYILHRGDTTARVQDMCFSPDSRWVTVSTLRGTTHVFPITPYGGNVGVRTHGTPHVVNKMSMFHRSAGLTAEGRSNSPLCILEAPINSNLPYHNPRLPPYPHPTVVHPLAQIRQPLFIQNSGSQPRQNIGRQRLGSSSEDGLQVSLRVTACFAPARAWIEPVNQCRETGVVKPQVRPVESLFIMSCHGSLIQYDLDPHHVTSGPKDKICSDTLIELSVLAKAQWLLQRIPGGKDIQMPVSNENLNLIYKEELPYKESKPSHTDDRWLSQVEIITHAGPHRRLWMGPQFSFKTYNNGTGASVNIIEAQSIDVVRSKPVNMPLNAAYPILIEAGSVSSCEPSPKFLDTLQRNFDDVGGACELQLKEELADAMLESPGIRESGGRCVIVAMKPHNSGGVAKVVNPLGMVVTVQSDDELEVEPPEEIIHENCDEALFRPVIASKAIVFAEPMNVQSKVAVNVLHIEDKMPFRKERITKPENVKKSRESSPKRCKDSKKADRKLLSQNILDQTNLLLDKLKLEYKGDKCITDEDNSALVEEQLDIKELDKDILGSECQTTFLDDEVDAVDSDILNLPDIELPVFTPLPSKEAVVETYQDPFFDASEAIDELSILNAFCAKEKLESCELSQIKATTIDVEVFDSLSADPELTLETLKEDLPKKPRKPKAKLGVRIGNLNKEGGSVWKTEEFKLDSSVEPTSTVWPQDRKADPKSSDDEKIETTGSQTETTESDDSSKVPVIIMDTEDDPQVDVKPSKPVNKSKKSKKKRR